MASLAPRRYPSSLFLIPHLLFFLIYLNHSTITVTMGWFSGKYLNGIAT
jgi:hypothetical protein